VIPGGDNFLIALPPRSIGDLFVDFEGDPFLMDGGLEYLFGIIEAVDDHSHYRALWGHDRIQEAQAFEAFVDRVTHRIGADPSAHVYHYAQYEVAALHRLAKRHHTREAEVERLIGDGVFVDLYRVVKQTLLISRESYSLKTLEDLYMPPRTDAITNGGGSIVAYETWRETGNDDLLHLLAEYNRRDCESTLGLRDWLGRMSLTASGVK